MTPSSFQLFCLLFSLIASPCLAVFGNQGACFSKGYNTIDVDWNKYAGKWYQVRFSSSFLLSSSTDKCTSSVYSFVSDQNSVKIENTVIKQSGEIIDSVCRGTIINLGHLELQFLSFLTFKANYEIVYLNEEYSIAGIVGCNGYGQFGNSDVIILARDFQAIDSAEVELALNEVKNLGFDVSDVIVSGVSACPQGN